MKLRENYGIVLVLGIYLLLVLGCQNEVNDKSLSAVTSQSEWVESKKLAITIESPQQYFYRLAKSYGDRVYAYNPGNHSVDVFDLRKEVLVKEIKLPENGPDKIGDIRDLIVVSKDSIICFSRNYLAIVNQMGSFVDKVELYAGSITGYDDTKYQISVKGEAGTSAGVVNKNIYVPIHNFEYPDYNSPERYAIGVPLIGRFDVNAKHVKLLNIRYPQKFRDNIYGFGGQPQFVYGLGEIVYYFSGFPELYRYNIKSDKTSILHCKIPQAPVTPSALNMHPEVHLNQVVQYTNAVYNVADTSIYQTVLYPKVEGERRKMVLRKVDLNTGNQKITDFPRRHAFIGSFMVPSGEVALPDMTGNESNLRFSIGNLSGI